MEPQVLMAVRRDPHGVVTLAIAVAEAVAAGMVAEVVIKNHRIKKHAARFLQFMHKVVMK